MSTIGRPHVQGSKQGSLSALGQEEDEPHVFYELTMVERRITTASDRWWDETENAKVTAKQK